MGFKDKKFCLSLIFLFSIIGLVVSISLLNTHFSHGSTGCSIESCIKVNTGSYSKILGVPVSLLGFIFYISILIIGLIGIESNSFSIEKSFSLIFLLSFFGLLFSLYLTYLELFVIHEICPLCVISAFSTLMIFILSVLPFGLKLSVQSLARVFKQ